MADWGLCIRLWAASPTLSCGVTLVAVSPSFVPMLSAPCLPSLRSLGSAIPVSNLYKIPFRRPPALGWFVFRPVLPCQTGRSGLRGGQFGKAKRLLPATSWRPAGCAAGAWGACLCVFLYTQAAHASITASPSACQPPAFSPCGASQPPRYLLSRSLAWQPARPFAAFKHI